MQQVGSRGFPGGTCGEEPACNAGDIRDTGSIPGPGRSPGEGNGNPLQFSCLENPMDRGAWWEEGTGKSGSYGMWNHPRGHVWNVFVRPASF